MDVKTKNLLIDRQILRNLTKGAGRQKSSKMSHVIYKRPLPRGKTRFCVRDAQIFMTGCTYIVLCLYPLNE